MNIISCLRWFVLQKATTFEFMQYNNQQEIVVRKFGMNSNHILTYLKN